MRRRRALACLAGGLAGLAGCSGFGGSRGTPGSVGERPATDTAAPAPYRPGEVVTVGDAGTFVLQDPRVQEAVFDSEAAGLRLRQQAGVQFLLFDLQHRGEEYYPPPTLRLDGEAVPVERFRTRGAEPFVARVPVRAVGRATVALNGVRWALPGSVTESLARRPRFRVREADLVARGDGAALSLTIGNDGDRDGIWRAVANSRQVDDGGDPISLEVPADETTTEDVLSFERPPAAVDVADLGPDDRVIDHGPDPEGSVGEPVPVPGVGDVTLTAAGVQEAVFRSHDGAGLTVQHDTDRQYLVCSFTGATGGLSTPTVRLEGEPLPAERVRRPNPGRLVAAVDLAFQRLRSAELHADGAHWILPNEVAEHLAKPAAFRLRAAAFVSDGADGTALELTVENVGTRGGVFRALAAPVDSDDAAIPLTLPVEAGERRTGLPLSFERPPSAYTFESEPAATDHTIRYREADAG
jgi:hypothetical protein